ncbi:MAG: FAD:protein FMN transferase [Gammaproteobacteria bacterium]
MGRQLSAALLVVCLTGCFGSTDVHEWAGNTMGTTWSVKVVNLPAQIDTDELAAEIDRVLDEIDASMSTYRNDSELMRFNASSTADWFSVSAELAEVLNQAHHISDLTGGAFDVTVGPLVNLWGFGPGTKDQPLPDDSRINETRQRVGYRQLITRDDPPAIKKLRQDLFVDLSAIAKGHGVDRISALLDDAGIVNYLVEIGGEVRSSGQKGLHGNWVIAVEQPVAFSRLVQTTFALRNMAAATSGDYRNFREVQGRRYSHVIDPRTGRPTAHSVASVTVLAESAAIADALATAMLVLGEQEGLKLANDSNIAALFIARNGKQMRQLMSRRFSQLALAD